MSGTTPYVVNRFLICHHPTHDRSIPLESQSWWNWLSAEGTTTFRFSSPQGRFTARRESKHGNSYWYAYRRYDGKLTKAYLGRSEELTEQRLCNTAQTMTERMLAAQNISMEKISSKASLLPVKFIPPSSRPSVVFRPRLVTRLNIDQQQAITLISAPAGSGKSSLLHMWYIALSEANVPVAWISLDPGDNDSSRFWSTFISAVKTLFPFVKGPSFRAPHSSSPEFMLAAILHDLLSIPEHFTLILDDYHVIESPAIQQAFTYLLDHLPAQIHLILATRTDPPFPLARLRAQGMVTEIRTKELHFTVEEATLFFHQTMQLDLSLDEITDLIRHTEGWIAGLQLAALSLQGLQDRRPFIHKFTGSHAYIVDYLAEEVLNKQPEHIQNFLISTSFLNWFTSSLCNSILDQSDGQSILRNLERMNLFLIPLDEQRHRYRYHALFADFLRHQLLQIHPERISELHVRAASWYEQHGYVEDAIQHFLAAPDFAEAARVIEQSCETFLKRGETATLLRWIEALPDEYLRARPYLNINYAGTLASIEQLDRAELHLKDAEQSIRERESQHSLAVMTSPYEADLDIQTLWGALAVAHASLAAFRGDVAQTIELSRQANSKVPEGNTYLRSILSASLGIAYARSGNLAEAAQAFLEVASTSVIAHHTYLSLISMCVQALLLMEKGRFYQAAGLYRQIIQQSTQAGEQQYAVISMAYLGLGEIHYYWNELDAAESFLLQGLHFEHNWDFTLALVRGVLFLARIKNARGRIEEAFAVLQETERQASLLHISSITIHIEAIRATLWLEQGKVEEAMRWAYRSGLSKDDEITFLNEFPYLVLAQTLTAIGNFDPATELLTHLLTCAEVEGRLRGVLDILLAQAMLHQQQHKIAQASQTLARAVSLAETEGNIRVFVEKRMAMRNLLSLSSATWAKDDSITPPSFRYIDTLLNAFDQQYGSSSPSERHSSPTKDHTLTSPLTVREQDVLRLIALGLSSQQIARELVISMSTVKWHLKQIYMKLNTHTRLQTVTRARELHLL